VHIAVAMDGRKLARRAMSARASERAFLGVSALLFAASAWATIAWSERMSAMGGSPMMWSRMPGQSWLGAAASFATMWTVMMVAMMLPSFATEMWRCRTPTGWTLDAGAGWLPARLGLGYFSVWTLLGFAVFVIEVSWHSMSSQLPELARATQPASTLLVLAAAGLQFTRWKSQHLVRCRNVSRELHSSAAHPGREFRLGMRLGVYCGYSCLGLTAVLLVFGVMDLRVMMAVAGAITAERVSADGQRSARAVGMVLLGVAMSMFVQLIGPAS